MKQDVLQHANAAVFNHPEKFGQPDYIVDEFRQQNVSSQTYTPTYSYINEGDINTDVKVDCYTDVGKSNY
ncbi:hypothetical protein [Bacillus thuringiensis]|uniref:hypothetical protein n=1 Tax=Bacillus thuringiensis TaxID=1428 RepID=UPI000BFCDE59|nr:hypothetical protein [Bacillus thuringiensis]PGY41315.1 hypothetical protein COE09_26135 [Bacillus thuringiensis]